MQAASEYRILMIDDQFRYILEYMSSHVAADVLSYWHMKRYLATLAQSCSLFAWGSNDQNFVKESIFCWWANAWGQPVLTES